MAENFPRVGRFSCVVVSTMSFSSKLAGHRGLESASLMRPPVPGQGKDRQTFRGGGRRRSRARWLLDVCLVPVTHFRFLVIQRCLKQASDHQGHPGRKVILEKSRKNPA